MRRLRAPTSTLLIAAAMLVVSGAHAHDGEHDDGELMVIVAVVPGGAADLAGLIAGDRVLSWEGQEIVTKQELGTFLDSYRPGDEISLSLDREGQTLDLPLTLGERADGGVSVGVSLGVASSGVAETASEGFSAAECVTWVDETYRMVAIARSLGLDLASEISENRACMERDTQSMAQPIPQTWCDNVFKIHCSGLDLLAQIGDAQVANCEEELSASLGVDVSRNKDWNVCGEQKVFDRYSMRGEESDEATCRRILFDECGAEIGE